MSTAVKSPIADPTTLQGEVDKEKSQSDDRESDLIIPLPRDFAVLPVPRHLRYNPKEPFHFGLLLNVGFGFISIFSESFILLPFFGHLLNNFDYSRRKSLLLSTATQ